MFTVTYIHYFVLFDVLPGYVHLFGQPHRLPLVPNTNNRRRQVRALRLLGVGQWGRGQGHVAVAPLGGLRGALWLLISLFWLGMVRLLEMK